MAKSWRLSDDRERFDEEAIELVGRVPPVAPDAPAEASSHALLARKEAVS